MAVVSPETTAAIAAVATPIVGALGALFHRRRRRRAIAAPLPPSARADHDARLRELEVAVARLQVVAERVEPLAESVGELRELAARLEALVEGEHQHADALNSGFQHLERLELELRGIALAPTIEIVASGE